MPRDARGCEAKKPTVMLSVNLRISVLTGGDVADSQKMALEVTHPHNDLDNIFLHTRYRAWGHPKHLLKPTLRLPHRTNARQLYAHVCGTHGGTFVWWRIRVTAVGEEWRVFEARERYRSCQTGVHKEHFVHTGRRATGNDAVAGNGT